MTPTLRCADCDGTLHVRFSAVWNLLVCSMCWARRIDAHAKAVNE